MRRIFIRAWFLVIVRPIVRLLIGVAVFGKEHLKLKGPAIIVANHNSHLDVLVLMDLLPLRVLPDARPVAAADYFEQSLFRRIVFQWLMNVIPIRRNKVTKQDNPLGVMTDAIDACQTLILFPEGTRGEPEKLAEFKSGVAHLIRKRPDVPVIPVYMRNLGFSLPRGELILVPMFCDIFISPPQHFKGDKNTIMNQLTNCYTQLKQQCEALRPSEVPEDDR